MQIKSLLYPVLLASLLAAPVHAAAPKAGTLEAVLAKPVDGSRVAFQAQALEDLGKNKYRVGDGKREIEAKSGPDLHHTLTLPLKQPLTFDGELRVKDKDGERKIKLELYRVTRADGKSLVVRSGPDKPWDAMDKDKAKAANKPLKLEWK